MASGNKEYLDWLEQSLSPLYSTPQVVGHDVAHVKRMLKFGPRMIHLTDLDSEAFQAAVWLHNIDRVPELKQRIDDSSMEAVAAEYIEGSNFPEVVRRDIVLAVATHAKKDDEPDDSSLVQALRLADKLDRLGPRGVLTSAQIHAHRLLYDPTRNPFRVMLGEGGWPLTIYDDLAGRVMEWPLMMDPKTHYLIDRNRLRGLIDYVRALAAEACDENQLTNLVEDDLRAALGEELYCRYAC